MFVSTSLRKQGSWLVAMAATATLIFFAVAATAEEPPLPSIEVSSSEAAGPGGLRISLDVVDAEVATLLPFLARAFDTNIIVGRNVKGRIKSVRLSDVTLEQTLTYVAQALDLQWEKRGDAYVVAARVPLVSVKVALVYGPGMLSELPGYYAEQQRPRGERVVYDATAGVMTIINPDDLVVSRLFQEPARYQGALPVERQEGTLGTGEERRFEFDWPPGRPQYFLEQVGQDRYRRVEVADKEGYTVAVRLYAISAQPTAQLQFARKTFTRGKYDETIRAFVGQPTLVKTLVTATAPVTSGQRTLVIWQPPAASLLAPRDGGAPAWAVGEWEMIGPGEERGLLTVKPDGSVIWTSGTNRPAPPHEPPLMYGPGTIDPSGKVQIKVRLGQEEMTLSGTLFPDGTAVGSVTPPGIAWTATRGEESEEAVLSSTRGPDRQSETHRRPSGLAVLLEVISPEGSTPPPAPTIAVIDETTPRISIAVKFVETEAGESEGGLTVTCSEDWEQRLHTLLQQGKARIINEPRIVTYNNVSAEVTFSEAIPYFSAQVTYDEYGGRQVDYQTDTLTATNRVSVRPRINEDQSITLDIDFAIQDVWGVARGPNGEAIPIVSTQEAQLTITVDDGETAVIGGMLHRGGRPEDKAVERIIFITPTIIRDQPQPDPEERPAT